MVNYKVQMPTKSNKTNKNPTKIIIPRKPRKISKSIIELSKNNRSLTDTESMYNKLKPYLILGVTLHRACNQALVPYTTAYDMYKRNVDFANAVDNARDNVSFIARSRIALQVKGEKYKEKECKYWLDNIDSGIKRSSVKGTKVTAGDVTISIVSYD